MKQTIMPKKEHEKKAVRPWDKDIQS